MTDTTKPTVSSDDRSRERRIQNFAARIEPTFEPDFEGEKTLVVTYNGRQEYRTALSPAEARKVFDLLAAEFGFASDTVRLDYAESVVIDGGPYAWYVDGQTYPGGTTLREAIDNERSSPARHEQRLKRIRDHGDPALTEAVDSGTVSISDAVLRTFQEDSQ